MTKVYEFVDQDMFGNTLYRLENCSQNSHGKTPNCDINSTKKKKTAESNFFVTFFYYNFGRGLYSYFSPCCWSGMLLMMSESPVDNEHSSKGNWKQPHTMRPFHSP